MLLCFITDNIPYIEAVMYFSLGNTFVIFCTIHGGELIWSYQILSRGRYQTYVFHLEKCKGGYLLSFIPFILPSEGHNVWQRSNSGNLKCSGINSFNVNNSFCNQFSDLWCKWFFSNKIKVDTKFVWNTGNLGTEMNHVPWSEELLKGTYTLV